MMECSKWQKGLCTKNIGRKKEMKIRSSKNRVISIAIAAAIISTCTIPNVIAESRNDINEPEQIISDSQEDEIYITGEIAELRSEYSKTYEQSDGSRIAVMSAAPICFYDEEKEEWKEYDNRLKFNEETETFESEETGSDMQVSLPKNIDEQNDIEVEADGYTVSITPINMNSSSAKTTNEKKKIKSVSEKSLKKYSLEDYVSDSVLDGKVEYTQDESAKVEYIFSGSVLKENIILSEAPIKNQTYSFIIKADGLTAKLKKDNTIKLLDKDEKAVFVIPAPYMYDSNFSFSDKIKTILRKEAQNIYLHMLPIMNGLQTIFTQHISMQKTNSEGSLKKVYTPFTAIQTAKRLNFLKKKCTIRNISIYLTVQTEHPNWYPR